MEKDGAGKTIRRDNSRRGSVREVAAVFLKLGTIAFGGPAAHIAMMHDETCRKRAWVSEERFLDLLGAANIIPGPSSTEMAIYLGYERAGWKGLVAGGVCFVLPAMIIVLAVAWAYVRYGRLPEASWLLYGVKPVIVAVIVQALLKLAKTAIKGVLPACVAVAVLALYLAGFNAIVLIFGSGLLVMGARGRWRLQKGTGPMFGALPLVGLQASIAATPFGLSALFFTFLKIGSVVFGSGYVLLAFLRADFVARLGWLTDRQILDAVAVGQFTPGPVFTTATFIGYLLDGFRGGLLGTLGIFLPSFFLTAAVFPVIGMLRRSKRTAGFLDGVNAGALGLMAGVTLQLGRAALVDWPTLGLAAVSAFLLFRLKINSAWVILGGGIAMFIFKAMSL